MVVQGQISSEITVEVAATALWNIYRDKQVSMLTNELLHDVIGSIEIVEGDGGVGTLVKVTLPAGTGGAGYVVEKYTKIDDTGRIKESEIIEGQFKEIGFLLYRVTLEFVENGAESTIAKSTIEYELKDEFASNASVVTTTALETVAQTIGKYLIENAASKAV